MKKAFLYFSITLAVIVIILFILAGSYTDRLLDPYVRSLLDQAKPMHHWIKYDKIRVNLLAGDVVVKRVSMFPDSSLTETDLRIDGHVNDIRLTGFSIWELLVHKKLVIDNLLVEKPDIVVILPTERKELIEDLRQDTLRKKKNPLLTRITLNEVILSNGSFKLMRNDQVLATSPDIDVYGEQIKVSKDSENQPVGFEYGNLAVYLSDIDIKAESSLYEIKLGKFSGIKKDTLLTFSNLSINPLYDKKAFSGKLEFQNDRFDVDVRTIQVRYLRMMDILEGKPFHISSLLIDSVNADIYRDKNVPFNFDRFPLFYNESFLKIPIPVYIDSVSISNSRVQYGELAEGKDSPGIIVLENFNVKSYDLTNMVEDDTIENAMEFKIKAKVMGEGPLNAVVTLPLEGKLHNFEVSGSVGAMDLGPLNGMLEPQINIRLDSGRVDRMTFYFKANDNTSYGWMEFLYHNLRVELLRKNPDKRFGFLSSVANTVALTNNPQPGKVEKIVEIGYERDKNKGIINYIWKTIQGGMVRTILPSGKYQINKQQAQAMNKLNRQQDRTQKKLDREQGATEKEKEKTTKPPKEKKK